MVKANINQTQPADIAANVCMVVHAHAPYVRQAGPSSEGEQDLHGLIGESYITLLQGLYSLVNEKIPVRLGLAISPILLEQLADPVVQRHTLQSLDDAVARAEDRIIHAQNRNDDHAAYVAQFYAQLHRRTLHMFEKQWNRNIVAATRDLVDAGVIELLAHTATHVVPQLHDQRVLRLQLETGVLTLMRYFGKAPSVLWAADDPLTPDVLNVLKELNIDTIIGLSDPRRQLPPTTWLDQHHQTCLIAPHPGLGLNVQSLVLGYPGDAIYRAPSPKPFSDGLLTNNGDVYDPFHAYARARQHARHFVAMLEDYAHTSTAPAPLVFACQTELFGSGWFEGGLWLRSVLELLAKTSIRVSHPSEFREYHPPQIYVPSWTTTTMRDGALAEAAKLVREAVNKYPQAYGDQEEVLNQLVRELLLAQSGDWDRWQNTEAAEYATMRRAEHLANIATLLEIMDQEVLLPYARQTFAQMIELDNPFPTLNYRSFGDHHA